MNTDQEKKTQGIRGVLKLVHIAASACGCEELGNVHGGGEGEAG